MKRILCLVLVAVMAIGAIALVGCNKTEETLKFGLGVYATAKATDAVAATEDAAAKDGQGQATFTAAAVTVDKDGKIVACVLDTADNTVKYTADGKAVANKEFQTKYEQGKGYNMVAWGGAAKEWYEQADAFAALVKGKTLAEVKALVAEGNKGTQEVIDAGCTIMINEFVLAIEKACNNAKDSAVVASNTLKLGVYTKQTTKDATAATEEDEAVIGENKVETNFFACAVDAEGKVVAATIDTIEVKFGFDDKGASSFDATKAVKTKYEQGKGYNMVTPGGAKKEWFEQADAFAGVCVGKTTAEIWVMCNGSNSGAEEVQAAGCTIDVYGFVKAAVKTGK